MYPSDRPSREFQKGLDCEERRRNRSDERYQLRKKHREKLFKKQRQDPSLTINSQYSQDGGPNNPAMAETIKAMLVELPAKVQGIYTEDRVTQCESVLWIRKLLSIELTPPIQNVIDGGVVPRLVSLMGATGTDENGVRLQFECAWALSNIASGSAEHTAVVIRAGAIPKFITIMDSPHTELVEQAIWALGNIAGDSPMCRNMVLQAGVLAKLIPICNRCLEANGADPKAQSLLRNATWALSNLCRGKPVPRYDAIGPCLPTMLKLLQTSDPEVVLDAAWAFSYLCDYNAETDDARVQAAVCSSSECLNTLVVKLNDAAVAHPLLRTIGNILTGEDDQTQAMIDLGAIDALAKLCKDNQGLVRGKKGKTMVKECCWAVSNICAGSAKQVDAAMKCDGLMEMLVRIVCENEFELKKEAIWALSNASSGGSKLAIKFLVHQGAVKAFVECIHCSSPRIMMVAMEGIENVLKCYADEGSQDAARQFEECGGLDKLEAIQGDVNMPNDLYQKAAGIVTQFFAVEGEGEGGDAFAGFSEPGRQEGGNAFAFGASSESGTGKFQF